MLRRAFPHGRVFLAIIAGLGLLLVTAPVAAQQLEQRRAATEAELSQLDRRDGVLTSEIAAYTSEIAALQQRVAQLRNTEARLDQQLATKQAELAEARARLAELRRQLAEALSTLGQRLVAIYKYGEPDLLSVVLNAEGFEELISRTEYLDRLHDQDSAIVERVRGLRDEMHAAVSQLRETRDLIVARRRQLAATRSRLESASAALASARAGRAAALASVKQREKRLEGDLSEISKQIAEQLGSSGSSPLPAGPVRGGSGEMIWPIDGTITSQFGWRWGRMHEGLDIAAPGGLPIRAAKSGNIELAAPTGGYGNYTCVDHGGGLSTCYAHQSGFARTGGPVSQGTVIGYVGTTGNSTGNHLHFEVRVNGEAVDPLGYL